jgi:DGQHR domain-containing protein
MTLTIANIGNQYSLRVPAHRFQQGERDVFSFALDLATLSGLLPERVDEELVKDANRRLTVSHAKSIQRYLLNEKSNWVLGSLLLGIAPDAVEFAPYPDENGQPSESYGELRILGARKHTMKIFDGQHRRRAIADALEELENDERRAEQLATLRKTSVPVVLYAEENIKALRQMFADASKTKPIESNTVTRFDERDAFNLAAMWLSGNSSLFTGRVEMERTTVRRAGECLVAINQLAAILKTLDVGYNGRVSRERNDDHMLDIDSLYERCMTWADDFMPAARKEYDDLMAGETDNSEISKLRPTTFAFNASVVRIFAGCYYEWTKDGRDWKPLAEFIRNSSLVPGKSEGDGALLVDAGVVTSGGTTPIPRAQEMIQAIKYIVDQAKAANKQITHV